MMKIVAAEILGCGEYEIFLVACLDSSAHPDTRKIT